MKISRSESENRFRELLLRTGFDDTKIKEPDSDETIIGTADFLLGDTVFEVKEIVPNRQDQEQIEKLKSNVANKKIEAMHVPDKTEQFKDDIKDFRKKIKKYPNYATVLVEDLTQWWWHEPDIEKMMFGTEIIHIDQKSGDALGLSWTNRLLRLDINRGIGSYIFITSSNILIYHNVMADNFRMMPLEYIQKFSRITPNQYLFVNIPNSPALIRQIM